MNFDAMYKTLGMILCILLFIWFYVVRYIFLYLKMHFCYAPSLLLKTVATMNCKYYLLMPYCGNDKLLGHCCSPFTRKCSESPEAPSQAAIEE